MTRRLFLLPLLALAAVLPFVDSLVAQQPKKAKGTQWAILIAGARYAHLQKIPGEETINDIVEFKKALLATGFAEDHIVLMHDRQADVKNGGQGNEYLPEHDKIVDMLGKFLKGMDEEDTVLVVLSGHGVLFKGDKFGYFCPVDAKLDPKTKLIPMEGPGGIYTLLEKCKAGRKLLISNTCRICCPRTGAPSRSLPHDEQAEGTCTMISSGSARRSNREPFSPGCLPGFRPEDCRSDRGGGFTNASVVGGLDEFCEFFASCVSNTAIRPDSSAISRSRPARAAPSTVTCSANS